MIIDPPVSPFSATADLEAWIATLQGMGDAPEVIAELEVARAWLAAAKAAEGEGAE